MRMPRAARRSLMGLVMALVLLGSGAHATPCELHSYTGSPVPVGSTQATITTTIAVETNLLLDDVNVQLDIDHGFDNDLAVSLTSPLGTVVPLFSAIGGGGDGFTGTVLDDQAAEIIGASSVAPFTGTFRPFTPLATLNGEESQGLWTLTVTDNFPGFDDGSLTDWSLTLCGAVIAPPCQTFAAEALGLPFGPAPTSSISSTIQVNSDVRIVDLNVALDITHTYDQDLTVSLTSPQGTTIQLISEIG